MGRNRWQQQLPAARLSVFCLSCVTLPRLVYVHICRHSSSSYFSSSFSLSPLTPFFLHTTPCATGAEILDQTNGLLHAFVCGAGTGGTLAGVSAALKSANPRIRCVLADPQGSSLYNRVKRGVLYTAVEAEGRRLRHPCDTITEGVGLNRLTANFAAASIDDAVRVSDAEAVEMAAHLLRCVAGGRVRCAVPYVGGLACGPLSLQLPHTCLTMPTASPTLPSCCAAHRRATAHRTLSHMRVLLLLLLRRAGDTWGGGSSPTSLLPTPFPLPACNLTTTSPHPLHSHDGLFIGSSSAVNCVGAVKVARVLGPGHTIVTVLCDGGARHLSRFHSPQFLAAADLLPTHTGPANDVSFVGTP